MNHQYNSGYCKCLDGETVMSKKEVMEFFNRMAPHWDSDLVVDVKKINIILDTAGVHTGVRVLDVACGTGVLFPFYAERKAAFVTAVDISAEMAKIAASKAPGQIHVICDDIETMHGTGDYDCCVVYNAFPHFPDPAGLIGHLAAWLKPGGRLTVAHSLNIDRLDHHHAGNASKVSRGMISAPELAALFGPWFYVDTAISDSEKYIVSGLLR